MLVRLLELEKERMLPKHYCMARAETEKVMTAVEDTAGMMQAEEGYQIVREMPPEDEVRH